MVVRFSPAEMAAQHVRYKLLRRGSARSFTTKPLSNALKDASGTHQALFPLGLERTENGFKFHVRTFFPRTTAQSEIKT